jgi:hypothetical protein
MTPRYTTKSYWIKRLIQFEEAYAAFLEKALAGPYR